MACYDQWTQYTAGAWRRLMSCGKCEGCLLEKSRQWAVRCVHEAQLHKENCFITLTYDEENVPLELQHRDFQLFMKKLRKKYPSKVIRYYMAGEYGEQTDRPHFHACLFGHDFTDKVHHRQTSTGHVLYTSNTLDQIWGKGFSSIGQLTFQSAAYIARYLLKKIPSSSISSSSTSSSQIQSSSSLGVTLPNTDSLQATGPKAQGGGEADGSRLLKPEYTQMSRNPGLGKHWLKKYKTDVYPEGSVVINGHKARPPKYYDQEYKKTNPVGYRRMLIARAEEGRERISDNTNSRLAAKRTVKLAQLSQLKRKI